MHLSTDLRRRCATFLWRRAAAAGSLPLLLCTPCSLHAQVIRGTVTSAVGAGRVVGAVVLLQDSSLTYARALTSDSGTFTIGAGGPGRFHIKVMRIGFRPTVSHVFDLRRDTILELQLTDIPVILPAVTTRDRGDCRLQADTSEASALTFALWDQARTAILAAAITIEQRDYRFVKLLHTRLWDVKAHAIRDISLREFESRGAAPWSSLPAEQLRKDGYAVTDDSGMTFFAPDLDVLLAPYFTEEHCFRITTREHPAPGLLGLDFEPARKPRHVEIRGTLWLDSATTELRELRFAFANLAVAAPDTLIGGRVVFTRLATGAWILPSWAIRMPTPIRTGFSRYATSSPSGRSRYRLTADYIRVAGGDLRAVRRGSGDSILWRRSTGSARITAFVDSGGKPPTPAAEAFLRLSGSPYGGDADIQGRVRFEQLLPGTYLFEATTPLHDLLEATSQRVAVTVSADSLSEANVPLKPLAQAAGEVCADQPLGRRSGVIAGHVTLGEKDTTAVRVRITVEWPGGDREARSRSDGYYRICDVPWEKLLLVKASADGFMTTTTLTLAPEELVRPLNLKLQP